MPRVKPRVTSRPRGERPTRLRLMLRRLWRLRRVAGLSLCAMLVLAAGGALVLRTAPALSPFGGHSVVGWRELVGTKLGLKVERIVVEGRSLTPEPLLAAAIGIHEGDPLLGFSIEAVRQNVERLTWVQSAAVERRLPGTLVVNLVERRPFAVWQNQKRFVLIDRAGQVVAPQDPDKDGAAFRTLPLVVGAGAPERAAELLDLLAAHPALHARVVAAVRVGERRWNLRLNTGADVLLPEGHEEAAIKRLLEFQEQDLLDRPLQILDMRLPDRLVLRPQGSAAPPTAAPGTIPGTTPGTMPAATQPAQAAAARRPT
jgi:cell division protein FtsQ